MFLEHNSNIMIEFQVLLCFENIMFRRFGEKARYSPIKVRRILALITDYFFLRAKLPSFDELYDQFLSVRDLGEGRRRHYEVLRRMIHRYESYIRCSTGRKCYAFDLLKVNKYVLDSLYDYIENENVYVEKFPKILEDNPDAREIKPRSENYMSGVFKEVRAFRKESSDQRSCQQSYGPPYLHRQHL